MPLEFDPKTINHDHKPYWERREKKFDPHGTARTLHVAECFDTLYAFDDDDLLAVLREIRKMVRPGGASVYIDLGRVEEYTPQFIAGIFEELFTRTFKTFGSYRNMVRFKNETKLFSHFRRIHEEAFYFKDRERLAEKDRRGEAVKKAKRLAARKAKEARNLYYERNRIPIIIKESLKHYGIKCTMQQARNCHKDRGEIYESMEEMASLIKSGEYKLHPC